MRLVRVLAALASAIALGACPNPGRPPISPVPPDAALPDSVRNIFGESTLVTVSVPSNVADSYGYVNFSFAPPSIEGVVRAHELEDTWLQHLSRTFNRDVRSASITLELAVTSGGNTQTIERIPLAVVSLDETDGKLKVEELQQQARHQRLSPLFRVDPDMPTPPTATATIRVEYHTLSSTHVVQLLQNTVPVAVSFGGHGWLANAIASPEIIEQLNSVERLLNQSRRADLTGTYPMTMSYAQGAISGFNYHFRLDPTSPTSRELGVLQVRLGRRPSAFTARELLLAGNRYVPDYRKDGTTEPDAAVYSDWVGEPLRRNVNIGQHLRAALGELVTDFGNPDAQEGRFNTACIQLSAAINSPALGLSTHDRRALLWAMLRGAQATKRASIQRQSCVADAIVSVSQYGLSLPTSEVGYLPSKDIAVTTLTEFMSDRVFVALALGPSSAAKRVFLSDILDQRVRLDSAAGTLFAGASSGEIDRSILIQQLLPIAFESGCMYRNPESGVVNFWARRSSDSVLWHMSVSLRHYDGSRWPQIAELTARLASAEDLAAMLRWRPSDARCHDPRSAPVGPAAP